MLSIQARLTFFANSTALLCLFLGYINDSDIIAKKVKDDIAKYEETITELKGKTLEDISRNNPEKSSDVQPLNSDGNQSNSQEFKAGVTYIFSKSLT